MLGEIPTRKGGKRAKLPFRGTTFQIYSTAITMKYIQELNAGLTITVHTTQCIFN